jgi:hypothetical protein
MRFNLTDLSHIPLPGSELAIIASDAKKCAKNPDAIISSCPWDLSGSHVGRCRRIVWRTTFRKERERLVDIAKGIIAGEEIAASFGLPLRIDGEIDLARRFVDFARRAA